MLTPKKKGINIPSTKRVCLNCDYFDHYFTPNRGNLVAWHPTDRGCCRDTGRELDAYRKACQKFEFVKTK